MKAWMTLTGAEALRKKLKAKAEQVEKKLPAALQAGALIVQNEAKEKAPYKTGNLKRSIHTEIEGQGKTLKANVGTNVVYARRQEYENKPYLRPALDENKDRVAKEIQRVLKEELNK